MSNSIGVLAKRPTNHRHRCHFTNLTSAQDTLHPSEASAGLRNECACIAQYLMLTRLFRSSSIFPLLPRPVDCRLSPLRLRALATMTVSPPSLDNISVTVDSQQPAIALIKFNRPKNANALSVPLVNDYLSALRWTEQESSIRIIITTGEGKFFTAGQSISHILSYTRAIKRLIKNNRQVSTSSTHR